MTNSLLTSLIVSGLLIIFAFRLKSNLKPIPGRVQGLVEMIIEGILSLFESVSGEEKAKKFFPLGFTFFILIVANNWAGLIPGVGTVGLKHQTGHGEVLTPLLRGGTADLNMTLALALISVLAIQYFGFKALKNHYFKKFIDLSNPINFFIGILETISEFSKIISFAFRLFGNIFAGEVLLTVIAFLIPFLAPLPFYGLEIFVGFIQALVFTMLTVVFLNLATISHQEH